MSSYPTISLPVGTILYSGGRTNKTPCPDFYKYIGQGNVESDGMTLYLTTNERIAEGYAINDPSSRGVVKKYRVVKNTPLYDITADYLHYDYDELVEFCDITHAGYYLNWGGENNIEIAMCSAPKYIEYVESKQRTTGNTFDDYGCKRGGRKRIKTKKNCTKKISRKIVYARKNIKAKTRQVRKTAVSPRM
jgi:hypothetical protein